jgi:hypothetical protein
MCTVRRIFELCKNSYNLCNSSNVALIMFLHIGKNKVTCGYGNLYHRTVYYTYLIPEVETKGLWQVCDWNTQLCCLTYLIIREYPSQILQIAYPHINVLTPNMCTFIIPLQEISCNEPGCGKVFTGKRHLIAHMRWHEGVKGFVCDRADCEMAFYKKSRLEIHKRLHTGEKPFKCDVCEKCFSDRSNLNTHKKIHTR